MTPKTATLLPAPTGSGLPSKPARVDVEVEPAVTDEQLEEALRECGNVKLAAKTLQHLSHIGIRLKGIGVTHIARGGAIIDQSKCDEVIDKLREAIGLRMAEERPQGLAKDLTEIASAFALVMGKKTDLVRLGLEIEQSTVPTGAPVEEGPAGTAVPNFQPGRRIVPQGGTVVIAQTANLNTGESKPGPASG